MLGRSAVVIRTQDCKSTGGYRMALQSFGLLPESPLCPLSRPFFRYVGGGAYRSGAGGGGTGSEGFARQNRHGASTTG
jgi:hypothetical protein